MTPEQRFRLMWQRLAKTGACDALDGMEYQRVYLEWVEAGKPLPAGPFILRRANIDASGTERPSEEKP